MTSNTSERVLAGFGDTWRRWRGIPIERNLAPYLDTVRQIRSRRLEGDSDLGLKERAGELRQAALAGASPDSLLVETFALACEASRRALGISPFDVQLAGGIALHRGNLAEMPTGEGKTLVAVFPACLNGLLGRGVHIFTANDYLARRDAAWMGPIYERLGLRVDCVQEGMAARRRQRAYAADVTYLTAREAGFDFLRDHLSFDPRQCVHRPFHFAIVDEADFILIDEARVPLVIAGSVPQPPCDHPRLARMAAMLSPGRDFQTDGNGRNAFLTEAGIARVEKFLDCANLFADENRLLLTGVNLALHARSLLRRDVDYIVRAGKIEIVDEFTGRIADRRRWPDGIQQAVEAKESLAVQTEGDVLGSITLQHFVKLYPRLCAMTATAQPAAEEFWQLYGLKTVVIPPNRPCRRRDHPDLVFARWTAKVSDLVEEIRRVHASGRPILVGTASVRESEAIAGLLAALGIACQVLNAKNDEQEAGIVAQAGALFAVTISTNMAGRGTDIRLGGADGRDHGKVAALGGLYVIGTNRHESRRIDLQLRGRAGRQGDPGSSRFFISLEDDLLVRYGIQRMLAGRKILVDRDAPIADPGVARTIVHAQKVVEGQNFDIRRTLHHYTSLLDEQRKTVCSWREEVLAGPAGDDGGTDGAGRLAEIERRATLFFIDRFWAEHLARIADIRENIHLFRLAGKMPLEEFHRQAQTEFSALADRVEVAVAAVMERARKDPAAAESESLGLRRPAATWVYLVNDNPFSETFSFLISGRNIGFAALAPLQVLFQLPLFLPLLLVRWWKTRFASGKKR